MAPLCKNLDMGAIGRLPETFQQQGNDLSPSVTCTQDPLNHDKSTDAGAAGRMYPTMAKTYSTVRHACGACLTAMAAQAADENGHKRPGP